MHWSRIIVCSLCLATSGSPCVSFALCLLWEHGAAVPWTSQKAVIMLWFFFGGGISTKKWIFPIFGSLCQNFWKINTNMSMLAGLPSNFRATSEQLPSTSEQLPSTSEHFRALPSTSEHFRATSEQLPSTSEHFRALPSNFRALPSTSEQLLGQWEGECWRNSGLKWMPVGKTLFFLSENYCRRPRTQYPSVFYAILGKFGNFDCPFHVT